MRCDATAVCRSVDCHFITYHKRVVSQCSLYRARDVSLYIACSQIDFRKVVNSRKLCSQRPICSIICVRNEMTSSLMQSRQLISNTEYTEELGILSTSAEMRCPVNYLHRWWWNTPLDLIYWSLVHVRTCLAVSRVDNFYTFFRITQMNVTISIWNITSVTVATVEIIHITDKSTTCVISGGQQQRNVTKLIEFVKNKTHNKQQN